MLLLLTLSLPLQLKASRAVFSEVNKRYPSMPFTLRALVDGAGDNKDLAKQMRLGLVECLNHQLLQVWAYGWEWCGPMRGYDGGWIVGMSEG